VHLRAERRSAVGDAIAGLLIVSRPQATSEILLRERTSRHAGQPRRATLTLLHDAFGRRLAVLRFSAGGAANDNGYAEQTDDEQSAPVP
jgi:hypothetical protein